MATVSFSIELGSSGSAFKGNEHTSAERMPVSQRASAISRSRQQRKLLMNRRTSSRGGICRSSLGSVNLRPLPVPKTASSLARGLRSPKVR